MRFEPINSIESMGSIPFAILAVAYLFMAGWGAGRLLRIYHPKGQEIDFPLEIIFVVAGLHVVSMCGVCLGLTGMLGEGRSLILLGLFALLGIGQAFQSRWRSGVSRVYLHFGALKPNATWLVIGPFVLLTLGPALNYPTGWDELVYHSVLPKRWLADGWPRFYVDIPYSGFPSLVEILCWLAAPIESLIVGRLLIWVGWMLGLVLAYVVFQRSSDKWTAICLLMALAASPVSLMVSANCYVEAFQLMDTLAIHLLLLDMSKRASGSRSIAQWVLIGILVGGCASIKLTGVIILMLPIAWYFRNGIKDKLAMACFPVHFGTVALWAMIIAVPFYGRAWMLADNPFYPYFANWFSNDTAIVETSLYHHAIGADAFGMRGAIGYVAAPILLAWDNALFDGTFGLQWLVLVGLMVLSAKGLRSKQGLKEYLWLGSVCLILYSFWFFSAQQARFALPWYLTILLLACTSLREIKGSTRTMTNALLVGATISSLPWTHAGYYLASWERLLGIWSNTQYVDDTLEVEYIPLINAIEKLTPANSRLLLLFEHRGLYIPRPYVIGTPFFQAQGLTPPEQYLGPEKLMEYLDENRFTHVLMATKPLGPDRSGSWWNRGEPVFVSLEQGIKLEKLVILWSSDCYVLVQVAVHPDQLRKASSGVVRDVILEKLNATKGVLWSIVRA